MHRRVGDAISTAPIRHDSGRTGWVWGISPGPKLQEATRRLNHELRAPALPLHLHQSGGPEPVFIHHRRLKRAKNRSAQDLRQMPSSSPWRPLWCRDVAQQDSAGVQQTQPVQVNRLVPSRESRLARPSPLTAFRFNDATELRAQYRHHTHSTPPLAGDSARTRYPLAQVRARAP